MHATLALAALAAAQDTGGIPVGKILPIIAGVLILVIGAASITIGRQHKDGNTGKATSSATVILIAVAVFALAGVVTLVVAFINGMLTSVLS